ncbi:hypothetical protein LCGC14_2815730 [marine sediment metagenome]|uniref:Uncharacterized protein n=1 Tax=marine sediment metagenome TaxID=412755 RepID=A0A0F9ARX9_9ZZZZ
MKWVIVLTTALKILLTWYLEKREKDRVRKKNLADARAGLKKGLVDRDTTAVFAAWDKVRRTRR